MNTTIDVDQPYHHDDHVRVTVAGGTIQRAMNATVDNVQRNHDHAAPCWQLQVES